MGGSWPACCVTRGSRCRQSWPTAGRAPAAAHAPAMARPAAAAASEVAAALAAAAVMVAAVAVAPAMVAVDPATAVVDQATAAAGVLAMAAAAATARPQLRRRLWRRRLPLVPRHPPTELTGEPGVQALANRPWRNS